MKLREILSYIPKEQLRMFALEYQVDRQVKKLSGEVMFYLLLFSSLNVRHNSLRTLEQFYSSPTFTGLFDKPIKHAKYNSISDRLRTINADYFKAIFESVLSRYSDSYLKPKDNIIAFDSTIVTLSSKLLKTGMKVGSYQGVNGIKFSVAFSSVPVKSKLFTQRVYSSEDVALKELIVECPLSRDNILLFDMGIQSRNTFDEFTDKHFTFVTRIREIARYRVMSENPVEIRETASMVIQSDYNVKLFNKENKDIFQELIENRVEISIELADGSIEEAYLTEKGEDYFKFKILNDNQNITSEEVITKDYLKRIKISNDIEREEYKNFKVITTKNDDEYIAYDLSYNGDYLIFLEKEEFYDIAQINIISKNMIDNISEIEVKLDVKRENFNDLIDLKKDLEILNLF